MLVHIFIVWEIYASAWENLSLDIRFLSNYLHIAVNVFGNFCEMTINLMSDRFICWCEKYWNREKKCAAGRELNLKKKRKRLNPCYSFDWLKQMSLLPWRDDFAVTHDILDCTIKLKPTLSFQILVWLIKYFFLEHKTFCKLASLQQLNVSIETVYCPIS